MPSPVTGPFDRLLKTGAAFAKVHAEVETSPGGSGYAGFVIDAQAREEEWLREHLAAFEKRHFDLPPPSGFAADDAALNRIYGELIKSDQTDNVPASAIRAAQRSWLAYRDAWLAFAAVRYPEVPSDSLKSALTQWRVKQLQRL